MGTVPAEGARVTLRAFAPEDEAVLLAGRDDVWARWLGPGDPHPRPTACILVGGEVVGWVDADPHHPGLRPGETNVGYHVFAPHRGRGHATEAVRLLVDRLRQEGSHRWASLSIHPDNAASLRVAAKAGFALVERGPDEVRFALALD